MIWSCLGAALVVIGLQSGGVPPALDGEGPNRGSSDVRMSIVVSVGEVQSTFVRVLPGTFMMGEPDSESSGGLLGALLSDTLSAGSHVPRDARPVRRTTITRVLFVHKTKVTAAQYCEFLNRQDDAMKHITLNGLSVLELVDGVYRPKAGLADAAVNTVPWTGAVKYCEWLSATTGLRVRLPTEAEWEWVARGPAGRKFPWGDVFDVRSKYTLEIGNSGFEQGACAATATPEGVMDMVGWVAEWCADFYAPDYDPTDKVDPLGPAAGTARVMRARVTESTRRYKQHPGPNSVFDSGFYGFRPIVDFQTSRSGEVGEEKSDAARE